jgi:hypothetical protein
MSFTRPTTKMFVGAFGLALVLAFSGPASAQVITVPTTPEATGFNSAFRNAARTYLSYYNSSQLTSLTSPTMITGMQLRISQAGNAAIAATWPSQTLSFVNFDVQLSRASAMLDTDGEILSGTGTFASLQGSNVTTVRSGPMNIDPAAFINSQPAASPFGFLINFSTPYLYTPGESLVMYLTHTGYLPNTEPQPFFAAAAFGNGIADAVSSTAGYQAANSNGFSSPYLVQFSVTPVPEPTSMALISVAGVGLVVRRLRRRIGK